MFNHASTPLLRIRSLIGARRTILAAVSCLALASFSAPKANAAEFVEITGPLLIFTPNGENETFGTLVTVGASDLSITGMGLWDVFLDGFVTAHEMGIWSAGSLIASATMPSGDTAPLGPGEWRWVDLGAPVTLLAGQTYTIGAQFFNGGGVHEAADEWVGSNEPEGTSGLTFSPDFTIGTLGVDPNLMRSFTLGFDEPVNVAGGGNVLYSVNLEYSVVPEPSVVGLMILAGALGMVFRRRVPSLSNR